MASRTIVFVGPHGEWIERCVDALDDPDVEVRMFEDEDDALVWLKGRHRAQRVRVVFVDVSGAHETGMAALTAFRESGTAERGIPLVAVARAGDRHRASAVYAAGAGSYLTPSVDEERAVREMTMAMHYWAVLNRVPTHRAGGSGPSGEVGS